MKRILFDSSKLRGRLKEKNETQSSLAKAIGITEAALCRKLNDGVNFKQGEILKIAEFLDIPLDNLSPYFFELKIR